MCFLLVNWFFPLMWIITTLIGNSMAIGSATLPNLTVGSESMGGVSAVFRFQNWMQCRRDEFYDMDYFTCTPCNNLEDIGKLQPSADKLSCKCSPTFTPIYEQGRNWPTCLKICAKHEVTTSEEPPTTHNADDNCIAAWQPATEHCNYQYLNSTVSTNLPGQQQPLAILLTRVNVGSYGREIDCQSCDLVYNFHYQGYCIANVLLRPYLHYNAFSTGSADANHFADLKFVAFFCMALRNVSACHQLANLCVLSHYSLDKHSPCSAFLLMQVSDVVMKYANAGGEQMRVVQPFLFYKKGKAITKMLDATIEQQPYRLTACPNDPQAQLQLFSTTHGLAGNLKRLGSLSLQHLNLCQLQGANANSLTAVHFAHHHADIGCQLTLEQLIDMATAQPNDNFLSIYLNYTQAGATYLQPVPVLIETLTPENQRAHREDWQLVRRFQLIGAQLKPRAYSPIRSFEDAHKLQLFRSLRYVEQLELHYDIHDGNRIGIPLLKLRYRHIELAGNATLQQLHPFGLRVRFQRLHEGTRRQLLLELALPLLLIYALAAALLRVQNMRRRRRYSNANELCQVGYLLELLLHFAGNVALALLTTALLLLAFNALEFVTQRSVQITLPLVKNGRALSALIYPACLLQFVFLLVQLRRASQLELFLIDWERPRTCEQNHFNFKSNLETSSVCSSVRTYVADSNVSAWRLLFTANEWIRLSVKQKYSTLIQAFGLLCLYQLVDKPQLTHEDLGLRCCLVGLSYVAIYLLQLLLRALLIERIFGEPLQKFVDLCSLANISLFSLLDPSFGYYIHGRSPHGFADTDISSMIMQLQREAQSMCGRRGLLMDSDKQAYIILPPRNLRVYLERLLVPFQRSFSVSQTFYQKDIPTVDGSVDRTSIAYASVNRFFCAFIDHAIKDMDYIIKEKTFIEKLLNCEFDNYVTENKGTFYIDDALSFSHVLLLGNHRRIFVLEILLLLTTFLLTNSILLGVAVACAFNMLMRSIFRIWVRNNVARKTRIDQRFLL